MREFAEWLQATSLSEWIQVSGWAIPLLQSIHILMIGIVFVSILMVALRIFGRVHSEESLADVWRRFAPWMWFALIIMVATGALLIVGEPVRELMSLSFWLKMLLLAVGVAGAAHFGRSVVPAAAARSPGADFPAATRLAAAATIVLWLAIIFLGRAIAYDVEVWGSLSFSA